MMHRIRPQILVIKLRRPSVESRFHVYNVKQPRALFSLPLFSYSLSELLVKQNVPPYTDRHQIHIKLRVL
jgi:hypothetical protein